MNYVYLIKCFRKHLKSSHPEVSAKKNCYRFGQLSDVRLIAWTGMKYAMFIETL